MNHTFFALVDEQLAEGQQVRLLLSGHSMEPTLHDGDRLLIEPLRDEPAAGDVLLFRMGDLHLLHRLLRREGDRYVMQGDHNTGCEVVRRSDLLARLVEVQHGDRPPMRTDSKAWRRISARAARLRRVRTLAYRWLGREGRRRLRPWYLGLLLFLMWAPLNGVGIPLDNYILGLRADHLLHASVYLPCALFLIDFTGRKRPLLAWLASVGLGLLTEGVQYLLPYRGFDINDLVANTIGVTLGWLAVVIAMHRMGRYKST